MVGRQIKRNGQKVPGGGVVARQKVSMIRWHLNKDLRGTSQVDSGRKAFWAEGMEKAKSLRLEHREFGEVGGTKQGQEGGGQQMKIRIRGPLVRTVIFFLAEWKLLEVRTPDMTSSDFGFSRGALTAAL